MLNIRVNNGTVDISDYVSNVTGYFDFEFEPEWLRNEFVVRAIAEVDDTEVKADYSLHNKVLGDIPPEYLSSGCKALILLCVTDVKINGDRMGDNCLSLLLDLAKIKDISISLSHLARFPEDCVMNIETKGVVRGFDEYMDAYGDIMYGC